MEQEQASIHRSPNITGDKYLKKKCCLLEHTGRTFFINFLRFWNLSQSLTSYVSLITDMQHPNWSAALRWSWLFHRGSWIFLVACGLGRKGLLLCWGLWASRGLDNCPALINPSELFHSGRTFHRCRNVSGQHRKLLRDWSSWAETAWYSTVLLLLFAISFEFSLALWLGFGNRNTWLG